MALTVIRNDNRFRLESQYFCSDWVSDTDENRKAMLVFLRLVVDENGKALFTHQQLAKIVKSSNRQACSHHVESFVACGGDFLAFLTRKRKVNSEVVDAVLEELLLEPLANISELSNRVNDRLLRNDISAQNIKVALESISYIKVRGEIQQRLSKGKAHYKEQYLLNEMMQTFASESTEKAAVSIPSQEEGMQLSDPTAIRSLLTENADLSSIAKPLQWVCFMMALYYHGLPLSLLGRWFKVHKTTILRWIISLALCLWPFVYCWINQKVSGKIAYIDEKWLKIKGKWHYWFVVLDKDTGLPVIASLLASKSKWSIRFMATQLMKLKKIPRVLITDGMLGYDYMIEAIPKRVHRILCHFHHQQGVTRYLREHFNREHFNREHFNREHFNREHFNEDEIVDRARTSGLLKERKKVMKKLMQTNDKRTVKRRFEKLKSVAEKLGISEWVAETERKLPKLLPAVGSKKIPNTNNAIERFFRAFNRFYKLRCGFFSVISAKRELIFFMLMYLFIKQPETGTAPVEAIMPEVIEMPFYQIVNDPIRLLMNTEIVKDKTKMADFSQQERLLE